MAPSATPVRSCSGSRYQRRQHRCLWQYERRWHHQRRHDLGVGERHQGVQHCHIFAGHRQQRDGLFVQPHRNSVEDVTGFAGGISNKGRISGKQDGILVGQGATTSSVAPVTISLFAGGINNSGTISAGNTGIFVGGQARGGKLVALEMFSGGIRNNGTISAAAAPGIFLGGIVTGSGTAVTLATVAGGITNSGRILAGSNAPAIVVGGLAKGTIASEASITVETFSGGVRNSGTIAAGGDAIVVGGAASLGGAITIESFSGGITNAGPIRLPAMASCWAATPRASVHRSQYRLSPGASAIPAPSPPSVTASSVGTNAGSSVVISTFSGEISNGGTIAAGFTGIFVGAVTNFGAGIKNTGKITATAASGIVVIGVSTFGGALSNAGSIAAGLRGIAVSSVLSFGNSGAGGGITNNGMISAALDRNPRLQDTSFSGGITNKGTINAGTQAGYFCLRCCQLLGGRHQLGRRRHQRRPIGHRRSRGLHLFRRHRQQR